jgi:hypothetical protein
MSAKKKTKRQPRPVAPSSVVRGFDLSTAEGSKAHSRDFARRKRIATEFYRTDFQEISDHLKDLDRSVVTVLADLTQHGMWDTIHEVARLAQAAHLIWCIVPAAMKTESDGAE